ncbi:MAG: YraN family protein [Candidatus Rokubacteria bacterium]|nr:YraN family protein [Candidatus Rokubacteria bacterium]
MDPRRSVGRRGEDEAARFLRRHGFVILDRNVRSRLGEIDLVARDGETLVFVEVKTRRESEGDSPQAAVTVGKQRRLGRLAQHYLKLKRLGEAPCRFDVVAITLDDADRTKAIRHLRAAFEVAAW